MSVLDEDGERAQKICAAVTIAETVGDLAPTAGAAVRARVRVPAGDAVGARVAAAALALVRAVLALRPRKLRRDCASARRAPR